MEQTQPCFELKSYLEVAYTCVRGMSVWLMLNAISYSINRSFSVSLWFKDLLRLVFDSNGIQESNIFLWLQLLEQDHQCARAQST